MLIKFGKGVLVGTPLLRSLGILRRILVVEYPLNPAAFHHLGGAAGAKGEKGDTGAQGPQGPAGADGKDGATPEFEIREGHLYAIYPDEEA